MSTNAGQQRRVPAVSIVVVLFTLSIYLSQYWIAPYFPTVAGLVQINPTLVFFDIPVKLPFTVDLILAPAVFLLLYSIAIVFFPSGPGLPWWYQTTQRLKAAFAGLLALLISLLTGGLIYYYVQGYLTTRAKNGINTLGMNADIHIPGYDNFQLRGSMILGVCFLIGLIIFIKKVSKRPEMRLTREQRMTPYERMLQERKMQTHLVYNTPKPVIAAVGADQPCHVQPVFTLRPLAVNYMPMS